MNSPLVRNTASSYFQFQQSLDQYVFFSPLTMGGSSGRAVKIHKDLFLPFFCVVDPTTHDGQSIIRQIENLRTTCTIVRKETGSGYQNNPYQRADHKARLTKISNAFHQMLIIKNLHVYYRVSQESDDKAPSIYIMDIRQISQDTGEKSGLYETSKSSFNSRSVEKMRTAEIDGRKVYINGSSQTVKLAMNSARYSTNDSNALLFYCSTRTTDELGVLGSKTKSRITTETINELTNVLKINQKASRGVSWYLEGEGVNVLAEAIKQIPGDLSTHEFRFINPIANTARLIEALTNKKAKFEGEFFKYDQNRASLIAIGSNKDELLRAIGKLPAGKNYDLITRNYIVKAINDLSASGQRAIAQQPKNHSTTKTFIQSLKNAGTYRK
ncbi:MAG: hypothetical protein B0W54_23155 [Cellvibrio sp. 79]|nr:MAG: hypothetical protein B0W54_23155 [Cellvibrio sp. 79]